MFRIWHRSVIWKIRVSLITQYLQKKSSCVIAEKLNFNKTSGADAIPIDVFKRGSARLFRILAKLFSSILKHTHLPKELMKVTFVPILKCKTLSAADIQICRQNALPTNASKLLETILQHGMKEYFCTSHAQFGFKVKHGT